MTNKPTTPDPEFLQRALEVAKQAARDAETVIQSYYQQNSLETEVKRDQTPVTVADKEAELIIRKILGEHFPEHGIYGEEFGQSDRPDSDYLWLIDPIDGTYGYIHGKDEFTINAGLITIKFAE